MNGYVNVQGLAYRFDEAKNDRFCGTEGGRCEQITCCSDADLYSYHLAPEGVNTEIPNIPIPSDVPEGTMFQSIKSYTATCAPPFHGQSITETASATSTISQQDADAKALEKAQLAAQGKLQCSACIPPVVFRESFGMGTYPQALQVPGAWVGHEGQDFRLLDEQTLDVYVYGTIDANGTLVIAFSQEEGFVVYDPFADAITNFSDSVVYLQGQISCKENGVITWPENPDY